MINECSGTINQEGYELSQHGTLGFPAAVYRDTLSHHSVPCHWHDELEIIITQHGQGIIHAGSRDITTSEHEGLFINSGVLHSVGGRCTFCSIVFDARLVGGNENSIFWKKYINPVINGNGFEFLHLSAGYEALSLAESVIACFSDENFGYEFLAREYLSRFILLLAGNMPNIQRPSVHEVRSSQRVKIMVAFIHEHFSDDVNTQSIANSASVSESECLRCFHSVLGTTPIQYLQNYRLSIAGHLLASSDLQISDIAHRCGFSELSFFSRVFRKRHNLTPSMYRKNTLNSNHQHRLKYQH